MRTRSLPALAALLTVLTVTACGTASSRSDSSAAASAAAPGGASPARLRACLKGHGVTLPARAAGRRRPPGGGGLFFGGGAGASTGVRSKFAAALKACGASFPRRRFGGRLSHAAITAFIACVRRHGFALPSPNLSGKGPVFPASIARQAAFRTASRACVTLLRPAGPGAGAPGAPPGAAPST